VQAGRAVVATVIGDRSGLLRGRQRHLLPWAVVGVAVAWNLWELRATIAPATYLNDSVMAEEMTRFATAQLHAGHDPLTTWFPYLGLGSPQFLHYQSAPAIVTGTVGLLWGADTAFRWSLYLLWCLWPVAVYASARLFGIRPLAAALAAAVAPLLASVPGVGYEQHAYVWNGYGIWSQLWASWALPFAWALSWRAMTDKRFLAPAAALVALTAAFHFESGYLAFAAVVIFPWLARRDLRYRVARAAVLLLTSMLASAWVWLPLLLYARWAALSQALAGTPLVNGYGAHQVLGWLVTGRAFDNGRLPVISLLVAAGLLAVLAGWRDAGEGRAFAVLFGVGLLLSFGRTTFGELVRIIPGSTDLFFRRFFMGSQLAGIYLAGLGAAAIAERGVRLAAAAAVRLRRRGLPWLGWLAAALAVAAGVVYLSPAWRSLGRYDAANAANIGHQRTAEIAGSPKLNAIVSYIRHHPDGRVYAGTPYNWGARFTLGFVPVYRYLASQDLDAVGFSLRTASLMSQPELHFDGRNLGDYALFGIRYLILPTWERPFAGTVPVMRAGRFQLLRLPGNSYIRVVDTVGSVTANRADIGSMTARYIRSPLPGEGRYLTVGFAGGTPAPPTLPASSIPSPRAAPGLPSGRGRTAPARRPAAAPALTPPGTVLREQVDLADGTATAEVTATRWAVVVLSASFDPGWSISVDGRPAATEMVAPALVAVTVPPGTHQVVFRYHGFAAYPELLALALLSLLAVARETGGFRLPRAARAAPGRQGDPEPG
jgi:hypothetical protein